MHWRLFFEIKCNTERIDGIRKEPSDTGDVKTDGVWSPFPMSGKIVNPMCSSRSHAVYADTANALDQLLLANIAGHGEFPLSLDSLLRLPTFLKERIRPGRQQLVEALVPGVLHKRGGHFVDFLTDVTHTSTHAASVLS